MKALLFLISFILLSTITLLGQKYVKEIDSLNRELSHAHGSTKVKVLDQLVDKCFSANKNKEMYSFLEEMHKLSNALDIKEGLFKTYFYLGLVSFNIEWKPSKAVKHLNQALNTGYTYKIEDPETYSAIYNNLGLIYKNLYHFDSALHFYKRASKVNQAYQLNKRNITLLQNMSRICYSMGDINLAINYAEECLNESIKTNEKELMCTGYKTMAEFLYYTNSPEMGLEYCQKAHELSVEVYGEFHSNTASTFNLLFKLHHNLGNYHESLMYANREYYCLKQIYGTPVHPKLAGALLSLGRCHYKLNNYDSALYFYKNALKSEELISTSKSTMKLNIYNKLAECQLANNDLFASMSFLKLAEKLKDGTIGQKSEIRKIYGDLYFKSGNYVKSLNEYKKAILIRLGKSPSDTFSYPLASQIDDHSRGLLLMHNIAMVCEILYRQNGRQNDLEQSFKAYQICDTLVNTFRYNFQNDNDKIVFNKASVEVYNGAIRVAYLMGKIGDQRKYQELAFLFAEKAKSNLLYQSIVKRNAMQYSLLPDSVLNYENEIKHKVTSYIAKINKEPEEAKKRVLKGLLFEARREYEKFQHALEGAFPNYYKLKYSNKFLTISEIQERLAGETILEFVLTDELIYVFLVKKNNFKVLEFARPKKLDFWIDKLRSSILAKDYMEYQEMAYQLYKSLFEPVELFLTKENYVIIVPDGKLWHLNFDLLLRRIEEGKAFYSLDYLINDYTISYANSANHLFLNNGRTKANVKKRCLAFSYSNDSLETSPVDFWVLRDFKHDLPGTREEIRSISKLLSGKYYFGSLASEANFKKESHGYSILHLALHGEVSDEDPLYSKLKFSPAIGDTTEDGYLNIYEIYNINLNSEMTVLSACNTGYGKLERGEGLMSLGRAFQYAGVNSLLLSNWGIPDEVAPPIMYDFYRYLKQGMNKSEAIRAAKLNYLKTAGIYKSAPFYWGSFVVIGDPSPLEIEGPEINYWLYFVIIISAFSLVLWGANNFRKRVEF
ncbi:CHAT domain-containing protein [Fulvivirga sp. 29W222]|uniref:CHAT domain-containing protein n=1 Tax=Fulvivirga marina TaxID=2494733 RepID=A0A937FUC3_9BACT|nr:CHAT domain-containing protein [Fulvivirga marina]MBL6446245.1 CHAT domain-containing protein [Fulvivirga marina]